MSAVICALAGRDCDSEDKDVVMKAQLAYAVVLMASWVTLAVTIIVGSQIGAAIAFGFILGLCAVVPLARFVQSCTEL